MRPRRTLLTALLALALGAAASASPAGASVTPVGGVDDPAALLAPAPGTDAPPDPSAGEAPAELIQPLDLPPPAPPPAEALQPPPPDLERTVLAAINRVRERRGLPPLRGSRLLSRPARAQSSGLLGGELRHGAFGRRLARAGFPPSQPTGEVLAATPGCDYSPQEVVDLWMHSRDHRASVLSPRFRLAGAGVATARRCARTVYTVTFGG